MNKYSYKKITSFRPTYKLYNNDLKPNVEYHFKRHMGYFEKNKI